MSDNAPLRTPSSNALDLEYALFERLVWVVAHDGTVHTAILWLPQGVTYGALQDGRTWFSAVFEFSGG